MGSDAGMLVYCGVVEATVRCSERPHNTNDCKNTVSYSKKTQ